MATAVSPELRKEIEQTGFAKTGDIGGQPKTTYWTPDGRMLRVQPSLHEYVQRDKSGKVIASGIRDANLDKGWLLQKPTLLKLYCPHCDMWHETQKEIVACEKKRESLIKNATSKIQAKEPQENADRLTKLETDMGEVKSLLKQLVRGK